MIGHQEVIRRVESDHPAVALFLGPESVGKWTAAEYLRGAWRVDEGDTLRVPKLTIEAARDVVSFSSIAPVVSRRRLAIIRVDRTRAASIEALLKTVEDGTQSTDFIFIAVTDQDVPPTLLGRAMSYRFRFLADDEVKAVLVERNFDPGAAEVFAGMSGGQVKRALDIVNNRDLKGLVLGVVRGFIDKDATALDQAAGKWTAEHTGMLTQWCQEAITGRWRSFLQEEIGDVAKRVPLRILLAINTTARPKLLIRGSLMSALLEG